LWGSVTKGDEMPYLPRHQLNTTISLEHKDFEINLNGRYNGAFRTLAGTGTIANSEKVAANFIVDLSTKYFVNKKLNITANVINLLDNTYAVSRVPAGLRPGHPFGIYGGLEFRF
jgi:Fe(3+) dicitrate transport protein